MNFTGFCNLDTHETAHKKIILIIKLTHKTTISGKNQHNSHGKQHIFNLFKIKNIKILKINSLIYENKNK